MTKDITAIKKRLSKGEPMRSIAADYYFINHADISRLKKNILPKDFGKRASLGLSDLIETEPCQDCGVVHTKPCPKRKLKTKRKPGWKVSTPSHCEKEMLLISMPDVMGNKPIAGFECRICSKQIFFETQIRYRIKQ